MDELNLENLEADVARLTPAQREALLRRVRSSFWTTVKELGWVQKTPHSWYKFALEVKNDQWALGIRTWYDTSTDITRKPTKEGMNIPLDLLPAFVDKLQAALNER